MKLRLQPTIAVDHSATLPTEYASLSDEGEAWISAKVKAGGHLNPQLTEALEAIDETQAISAALRDGLKPDEMVKAERKDAVDAGEMVIKAYYDFCVDSWETNIIDEQTGRPIEPNWANFWALFNTSIPAVVAWVRSIPAKASNVSQFLASKDEETEKN